MELINEKVESQGIQKKYAEQLALASRAWGLISPLVTEGKSIEGKTGFFTRWISLAFFTRQMRSFRSVVLLLERGLVPEAKIILRPMVETHLHFDFFANSDEAEETARLYIVWEYANGQKLVNALNLNDDPRYPELNEEYKNLFAGEKKRFGTKRWKQFVKLGPPMLSVEALAKRQKSSGWYDTIYRSTSSNIHVFNLLTYVKPTSDNMGFKVNLAPLDDGFDMTVEAAMALALEAGLRLDRLLGFGKKDELLSIDSDIRKAIEKRLTELSNKRFSRAASKENH